VCVLIYYMVWSVSECVRSLQTWNTLSGHATHVCTILIHVCKCWQQILMKKEGKEACMKKHLLLPLFEWMSAMYGFLLLTLLSSYSPPLHNRIHKYENVGGGRMAFPTFGSNLLHSLPSPPLPSPPLKRKIYELTLLDVCLVASLAPWMFYS
jgi:hypothetical protein